MLRPADAEQFRVVVVKADGLPGSLVELMLGETDPRTGRPVLPWMRRVFAEGGVRVPNFYSRGVSLSVPAWSILDTGRPMAIRGNVEYDRYTLRSFDYLNFVPFYIDFAFSKAVDMPGVAVLDDLGVALAADRFGDAARQSFQLFQRGIYWPTIKRSLRSPFPLSSPRSMVGEWQAGVELTGTFAAQSERDMSAALADPELLYLDLFTGEFDHVAHLDRSREAQREVVVQIDALVGRLWTAIERSPLAERTVLALVSDHGMNTKPDTYSQGFSLVELLTSPEGGSHHTVTNRFPLSDYKLQGLNPFVHRAYNRSKTNAYESGAKHFPTALLDLDGNERAGVYLRNSDLNVVHLLLLELERRDLTAERRAAVAAAGRAAIERYRQRSAGRVESLRRDLDALRQEAVRTEAEASALEKGGREQRRLRARIRSWEADLDSYADALAALDRLFAARLDRRVRAGKLMPERFAGEPNTIRQIQNYVVGPGPDGLAFHADGSLDEERSFRRIDYFRLLTGQSVRNVVQPSLGRRPVDFVAVRANAAALAGEGPVETAVWVYGGPGSQLMLLARPAGGGLEYKVLPVSGLRETEDGRLEFERRPWAEGFPLSIFEDEEFVPASGSREEWLSVWHGERDWLRAIHRTHYSNAVIGLVEHFRRGGPPPEEANFHWRRRELVEADMLVLARDGWNFNVRSFNPGGNHGSFFRISTQATLMLAGGAGTGLARGAVVDEPYDALSLTPTLLDLAGRPDPSLPGPLIRGLRATPATPTDAR